MRAKLHDMVHSETSPAGRAFNLAILGLILLSMLTFALETLPGLSETQQQLLFWMELSITLLFTLEYLLRIATSRKPFGYIFSFYGMIDLLAIAPFWLALGLNLNSLRMLRMLRLFRLLKLTRYSSAIGRMKTAVRMIREELIFFACATAIVLYLAAVGIYYFEHQAQPEQFSSVFHGLWWAVATLTTVGYGDTYPITAGGRIFTTVILLIGLGIVTIPTGLLASALSVARRDEQEQEREQEAEQGDATSQADTPESESEREPPA